jgi:hypothetical protein
MSSGTGNRAIDGEYKCRLHYLIIECTGGQPVVVVALFQKLFVSKALGAQTRSVKRSEILLQDLGIFSSVSWNTFVRWLGTTLANH